ncbi:hypothetical protein ACWDA7_42230 [Streptomyces sp. NPDC001156]
MLIRERTHWGFVDRTVAADSRPPERPYRIGVLILAATRVQRLALRCLTRRPAQRETTPSYLKRAMTPPVERTVAAET